MVRAVPGGAASIVAVGIVFIPATTRPAVPAGAEVLGAFATGRTTPLIAACTRAVATNTDDIAGTTVAVLGAAAHADAIGVASEARDAGTTVGG